jgi:hypothetical protein
MNYRINATERFDIDISGLGIPLDFIWCHNWSTYKTLNCMAFTLEVTNERGTNKSGGASNGDALWQRHAS